MLKRWRTFWLRSLLAVLDDLCPREQHFLERLAVAQPGRGILAHPQGLQPALLAEGGELEKPRLCRGNPVRALVVEKIRNNPPLVGKLLALVSPALAVGVVCFMLFASGYSYVSMEGRAGPEGEPVEATSESGWVSAYEHSLENGDYVYFLWSGFIVVVCLLAAGAALKGWVGLVWACAGLLGILSILGALTLGAMVAPLALTLFVSAILLGSSRPEDS